jgi:hypothetical protein
MTEQLGLLDSDGFWLGEDDGSVDIEGDSNGFTVGKWETDGSRDGCKDGCTDGQFGSSTSILKLPETQVNS